MDGACFLRRGVSFEMLSRKVEESPLGLSLVLTAKSYGDCDARASSPLHVLQDPLLPLKGCCNCMGSILVNVQPPGSAAYILCRHDGPDHH